MSDSLRIIFAGTPDFAAQHLEALISSKHNIIGVYTQPDRPAGRGKKLTPSAVKVLAQEHHIPVYQPASLKAPDEHVALKNLNADLMVVVAYGLLLPKPVLEGPRLGCINVHGSILPAWRGAAPIQRSLWAGDKETGVTIMQMDEGLDTGDMLHISTLPISPADTSATLYQKLADLGPKALIDVVDNVNSFTPQKQNNDLATYAKKLSKQEAMIDWNNSAEQLERNIRAFNPWPVAWISIEGNNVKIWQASVLQESPQHTPGTVLKANKKGIQVATSDGILNIERLQLPGKKPAAAQDVINARQQWFTEGKVLSSEKSE